LTLYNAFLFLSRSVQLMFSNLLQHHISKNLQVFLTYSPKCLIFSTTQSYDPNVALYYYLP
jgi:hypothetical protein